MPYICNYAIVNLTIADKENWPDIIFWNWNNYSGGVAGAIEDGLVLPLNHVENWEEAMPIYSQLMKDNAYVRRALTLDNGDITGCCHVEQDIKRNAYSGFSIRTDWLENVGMEMPVTAIPEPIFITSEAKYPKTGYFDYTNMG